MSAAPVQSFRIMQVPFLHWNNNQANKSRGKKSARGYEIELTLENGKQVRDRMVWLAAGAGRDCFALEKHRMCVKWFHEVNKPEYQTLHKGELEGFQKFSMTSVGQHLPRVHACCRQVVRGHNGYTMEVDCILMDFAGEPLSTILALESDRWGPESVRKLKVYFLAMLRMCEKAVASDLEWHEDFHSGNICFNVAKQCWFFVDLEGCKARTRTFEVAAHQAGKRQKKDVDTKSGQAFQFWSELLETHMMQKHHCGLCVGDIAKKLKLSEANGCC